MHDASLTGRISPRKEDRRIDFFYDMPREVNHAKQEKIYILFEDDARASIQKNIWPHILKNVCDSLVIGAFTGLVMSFLSLIFLVLFFKPAFLNYTMLLHGTVFGSGLGCLIGFFIFLILSKSTITKKVVITSEHNKNKIIKLLFEDKYLEEGRYNVHC